MRSVPLVLSALLIVAVPLTAAKGLELSRDQERRLEGGEVVVVDELPPGGMVVSGSQGGTGLSLVHASPEAVWQVLVNYAHHPGMYPRVVRAQVLKSDSEHGLVRYVSGLGAFSFGFHVESYLDGGRRRIVWRLAQEWPNDLFRDGWGFWQIDLPVSPAVAEEVVRPLLRQPPHDPPAPPVEVALHVEPEREGAEPADVADEPVLGVGLENLGPHDPRVHARVMGIVHEHLPDGFGGRMDQAQPRPALAPAHHHAAGREFVNDDDLPAFEPALLIPREFEALGGGEGHCDNEEGGKHQGNTSHEHLVA